MAKYKGQVVIIGETNLPALFYIRYMIQMRMGENVYPQVYFYDLINKKLIDTTVLGYDEKELSSKLDEINEKLEDVRKTVSHGFKFDVVQSDITNEGDAEKLKRELNKKLKAYEAPFDDMERVYGVQIYNV